MKKLFIYALLVMTGFAFYSCDERFDNPVTEQQDASSPYATWTYEVGIQFQEFYTSHPDLNWNNWGNWDIDGEDVFYKAPTTVYVYNKAGEFLGEMNATEEFDYDNFDWSKYYKFAGTLTGAIGEELVISTLKDFDYYSKQDGTLKSLVENCILEIAEVPIIIANNTTKKIGTQNAQFKSAILAMFGRFDGFCEDADKSLTLTSDSVAYVPANEEGVRSFTIKLADAVKPKSEGLFWAFAPGAKEEATYTWELNSDNGYKSINIWKGKYGPNESLNYIYWLNFQLKEIDLTKYFAFLKEENPDQEDPFWVGINSEKNSVFEPFITQSGKEAVDIILNIQGKATIQDINIKGALELNGYKRKWYEEEYDYLPVLTVKGSNVVENKNYAGICINATATIQGDGTITSTGDDHGLVVNSSWNTETQDDNGWSTKGEASVLTIAGDVKIIANGLNMAAVYVGKTGAWSYPPYSGYDVTCVLNLNGGTLEAIAKDDNQPAVLVDGTLNIGSGATMLKGTAGKDSELVIVDGSTWTEFAKFDETKFTDTTKDGVRTITPKK